MKTTKLLILFTVLILFLSCNKEKENLTGSTPFYKLWGGYWLLDSVYHLNGEKKVFDKIELTTRISIEIDKYPDFSSSNSDVRFDWNDGFEVSKKNAYTLSWYNNKCYFKIQNDVGLFYPDATYIRPTGLNSILLDLFPNHRNTNNCTSYLRISQAYIWKQWAGPIYMLTNLAVQTAGNEPDLANVKVSDIDYFRIDSWLGSYYKITELNTNQIKIDVLFDYYHRIINGKKILDKCSFILNRDNNSGIITIPPFNPNSYKILRWHNCIKDGDGLTLKGSASIQPNGIDNNCLFLNGLGSYAEFDRKPQVPTTLSFWVKPDDISRPKQVLFSKYKNKYGPFIMSLEQDKFALEINDGFGNLKKVTSTKSVNKDQWNHICLTVDTQNKAVLYINGEPDSQGTINSLNYDADAKILFGTTEEALKNNIDVNFRGYLDEFIFFEKDFEQGEVKQLFIWHLTN
jgi:hypothetical protein